MRTIPSTRGRRAAAVLIGLAGVAASASAQDCRLTVKASDPVLTPGETAGIDVFGRFPATGFALASADFDVFAGMPGWASASAGVIAGPDVIGVGWQQTHMPHVGVLADPANPLRIWNGVFAPAAWDPALVPIRAVPTGYSYYPSELTGSSVACDAEQGRTWVMVNPRRVGGALAAPGAGTDIELVGDELVVGTNPEEAILIGLLLPAVQKVRDAAPQPVDDLTIETVLRSEGGDDMPIESISMHYSRAGVGYDARVNWPLASGHMICHWTGRVIICIEALSDGAFPYTLPRLPDTHRTWVEQDAVSGRTIVYTGLEFDEPIEVGLPGTPPTPTRRLVVQSVHDSLLPIGVQMQIYFSHGTPQLSLTVESACEADFDGNGTVNSSDISAFLAAWLGSLQGGSWAGDFDRDAAVNSADISAFLVQWLEDVGGC